VLGDSPDHASPWPAEVVAGDVARPTQLMPALSRPRRHTGFMKVAHLAGRPKTRNRIGWRRPAMQEGGKSGLASGTLIAFEDCAAGCRQALL